MQRWALLLRKKDPHRRGLSLDRIGVLFMSLPHVVPGASRWDQPQTTFMIDFYFYFLSLWTQFPWVVYFHVCFLPAFLCSSQGHWVCVSVADFIWSSLTCVC